ncbi:MAG: hypothetical protein LBJ00_15275 [Planctomycetaceae bacterium]|jgi:hypothetical protein|nr:hypothetical protein [Planctomycetaceae bacterium]
MRYNIFLLVIIFLSFSGCQTLRGLFERSDPKPPVHPVSLKPTFNEIIDPINRNSAMIRNIAADNVTLTFPDVSMPINVKLTCERPKRIRIIGGTSITGQEIDFGSNDELFWVWLKREQNTFYCKHAQFPTCPVRDILPFDPDWLIEALGIVEFKDNEQHEGPHPSGDGNWVIITRRNTQTGQFVKKTTVDAKTGFVIKQEIFSPQNELLTAATSSDYRFDVQNGIAYARKIEIFHAASAQRSTGTTGKISINLGSPQFNQNANPYNNTYVMPTYDKKNPIDICGEEFLRSINANSLQLTNPTPAQNPNTPTPNSNTLPPNFIPSAANPANAAPTAPNYYSPSTTIPTVSSNNTIHNSLPPNNAITTYQYNTPATSQGNIQTEVR